MICHNCHKVLTYTRKLSFREVCPHCDADLHCCKGCKFYCIGKPNDCLVPNTDLIVDRAANNFCEEFAPIEILKQNNVRDIKTISKNLFKDNDTGHIPPSSFDDLFK